MNNLSALLSLILFVVLTSCQPNTTDQVDVPQNPFFDLKEYFEQEMKIDRGKVTKTTIFKGEKETIQIPTLNLSKELKIFADANLNKVAWYEKYSIASEEKPSGKTLITYYTDDPKLKTKKVELFKTNDQLDSILIHKKMKSMIMDSDQFLSYYPNVGYHIKIKQASSLQESSETEIKVLY